MRIEGMTVLVVQSRRSSNSGAFAPRIIGRKRTQIRTQLIFT